ncbi:TetR/AcrR family transcriptional regulator [Streptomyces sp. A30]|uniref:TetR/AcrR family transcriptional regulator n=1 Tax=Streptomyces sp. A30 TaxID=2789273 RepID=UPI003980CD53
MSPRPMSVTNEQIFVSASRTLARIGPLRVTLNDVASDLGISAATLVKRFGSKHDLLVAINEYEASKVDEFFTEIVAKYESPLEALYAFIAELSSDVDSPAEMANHVAFLHLDLSDDALHYHAVRFAQSMRTGIASLLERAVEQGELVECDVDGLARAVQTAYNGALIMWAILGDGELSEWVRRDVAFLLNPFLVAK